MIWTITLWMAMQGRGAAPAVWETPSEPNAAILLPPNNNNKANEATTKLEELVGGVTQNKPAHCEPHEDTLYCYGLVVGAPDIPMTIGRPEEWQCPSVSTEHAFEIKTKRKSTGLTEMCSYATFTGNPSCRTIPTPKYCPDGNYCKEIVDVTRELWMDGKRLGTIEGLD